MKNLALNILMVIGLISCTEMPEIAPKENSPDPQTEELMTRASIASDQNPYSLTNIQHAYNSLRIELGWPAKNLKPTHAYVRFQPSDSTQYGILHDSLFLELFDYPLDRTLTDYEIKIFEKHNTGPSPHYYTIVPAGLIIPPEIEYEVLDGIYLQRDDTDQGSNTAANGPELQRGLMNWVEPQISSTIDWDKIVDKSFQETGNDSGPQPLGHWDPSATIMYVDSYTNRTVPLEGVKIRVSNFVNVGSAYTTEEGHVHGLRGWGGRFKHSVRYKIIFENDGHHGWKWNIRDGRTGQA